LSPVRSVRAHLTALAGFVALSVGSTWPLATQLTTHLTGSPTGDTGVYVWNLWIFSHEIFGHGHLPWSTQDLFAATNGVDLTTHNYTVFADLIGLPLIPVVGVVGAFNLVFLLLIALSGYAACLLARRLIGGWIEPWLAGAAFAASPVLVARGSAHFSLVAAAPLPLFALCLLRAFESRRRRDALLAGAIAGWAGYCDVYFPIYCVLIGAAILARQQWQIRWADGPRSRRWTRVADGLLAALAVVIAWRWWHGPASFSLFGHPITIHTVYTPMLLGVCAALARAAFAWRGRLSAGPARVAGRTLVRLGGSAVAGAAMVLSPELIGLALRIANGRFPHPPLLWRSGPPGLDLLELALPNPNHPWFGAWSQAWISASRPNALPEFVGSLSLVAIGFIVWALWRSPKAVPKFWMLFTAGFSVLALGPFLQVGTVNTQIPLPWALLRYVPVLGLARSPSRLAIVATLGLSICLAFALRALRAEWPSRWRPLLAGAAVLLAAELLPAPRPLFEASVPLVYSRIALDADESKRVLELPGGVRDGTTSLGDFNASAQFFQTVHRKPLIGGYLSRVSDRMRQDSLDLPVLAALYGLSEGHAVPAAIQQAAFATRDQFLRRSCLGYVVIDRERASAELQSFATSLFDLVAVAEDHGRQLLVPGNRRARCGTRASEP